MLDKILTIIILVIGIIGVSYIIREQASSDFDTDEILSDSDELEQEEKILIIDGYKALELDDEVIQSIGLEMKQLTEIRLKPEVNAFAEVLDITPLVDLRTEHSNLQAERNILRNALNNQTARFRRAKELHEIKGISTSEYEQIRSDLEFKSAESAAMNTQLVNLEYKIRSDWGEALAGMIMDPEKEDEFNSLAMQESVLVRISLPRDRTLTDINQSVYVNNLNVRESAVPARYIDKARRAGNPLYGESYLYLLDSYKYQPGMRLFAWLEETDKTLTGLFMPDDAVIWYANEPWVYIQHDNNFFIRKPLARARKIEDGWLLSGGFDQHDKVVIHGGQTLLSEEFKWAIPDEDDD